MVEDDGRGFYYLFDSCAYVPSEVDHPSSPVRHNIPEMISPNRCRFHIDAQSSIPSWQTYLLNFT